MKTRSISGIRKVVGYGLALTITMNGLFGFTRLGVARSHPKVTTSTLSENAKAATPLEFPLTFEANKGQTELRTKFLAHAPGYRISLAANGVTFQIRTSRDLHNTLDLANRELPNEEVAAPGLEFEGADPRATATAEQLTSETSNYLMGADPRHYLRNIPHYGRVRFNRIYPGIDVAYYGARGQLEYDLVVAPGAKLERLRLRFDGAEQVEIDRDGHAVMQLPQGKLVQRKPHAYQDQEGKRVPVAANYVLRDRMRIGIELGSYDHTKPLVIDPVIDYSTYLGGSSADTGTSIAVDRRGRVYLTGITTSVNFPASNGSILKGQSDLFVARLNPAGTALEYSTFIGGQSSDEGSGIAVDAAGSAYVTGTTASVDFPTTAGVAQSTLSGPRDAFVAKLAIDGSNLVYSTFVGGSNVDEAYGLALNSLNEACITGLTDSDNFPTSPVAFQLNKNNDSAAFVTKLNASGSALLYSSYLGGAGIDWGLGIATDAPGNIYVTGVTTSNDFPATLNAAQGTLRGLSNSFIAKFIPSQAGQASLSYSTFLGGGSSDTAYGIAVDSIGNVYVAGSTNSANLSSTNGVVQANKKASSDAFVAKLRNDGTRLLYLTYLGGDGADAALSIQVDSAGQAFFSGFTQSQDFPVTANAYQPTLAGKSDAFVTKLKNDGSGLVVSTYLGGADDDEALGLKIGIASKAYLTGETISTNFPAEAAIQGTTAGSGDAFVTKLTAAETVNPSEDARFFARQHYIDFLSREPDTAGWDFWTAEITACGPTDLQCIHNKRIDVSNAFFYELEFQQTGSFVYRVYRAAYGNNQPFPNPDSSNPVEAHKLVAFINFFLDRAMVVGGPNLAQSQLSFTNVFVQRPEFLAKYPATLDGPAFVDAVLATVSNEIGVDMSAQRTALLTLFNQSGRGGVLYRLADDNLQTNPIDNRTLIDLEYNRAFVATQYFGYLRRDADIGGFLFWLGQVNGAPLRDVPKQHAMVCSFITSAEYQLRFGSLTPHSNAECPQ